MACLVGCGMMGREHIHNLQLIGGEVAVIVEPDSAMRSRAGELAPKARFADSVDELLGSTDINALIVATPARDAGPLHVRRALSL